MIKNLTVALLFVLTPLAQVLAGGNEFRKSFDQVTKAEWNALAILARDSKDVFFDAGEVQKVVDELSLIQTFVPSAAKISDYEASPSKFTTALLKFQDSVEQQLLPEIEQLAAIPKPVKDYRNGSVDVLSLVEKFTDIQAIQALAKIEAVVAHYSVSDRFAFRTNLFVLGTATPINIRTLISSIKIGGDIAYIEPNGTVGDGHRIYRKVFSNTSVRYIYSIGSGDCPAGCINRNNYIFDVNPETPAVTHIRTYQGRPVNDQ